MVADNSGRGAKRRASPFLFKKRRCIMLVPAIILGVSIIATFVLRGALLSLMGKEASLKNACLFILTSFALSTALYFAMVQLLHIHTIFAITFMILFILL